MDAFNNTPEIAHEEILKRIIAQLKPVNFVLLAFPQAVAIRNQIRELETKVQQLRSKDAAANITSYEQDIVQFEEQLKSFKVAQKHYLIISNEELIRYAEQNSFGLCKNNNFIYLYNGAYWKSIDKEEFQQFLGEASERLGVEKFSAKYYIHKEQMFKQFIASAYLATPEPPDKKVLVNLKNGTFEVTTTDFRLRRFDPKDFITYQLPFSYLPQATAPIFHEYLGKVLPDKEQQMIVAEYLGYLFIPNGVLKLEKALMLYGTGANGKSVLFDIVSALLGKDNVSNYSLQSLTDDKGYQRAMLANKLVNYASEISGNLETSVFKQLVSGEAVEARLPYGEPFTLSRYGKLIFNVNELPKKVEYTHAYFRRFLIIPFNVTIPEEQQDRELASKIIAEELPGVFNWLLAGLKRLLEQRQFTHSDAVNAETENYRKSSDEVQQFLEDGGYITSISDTMTAKELYEKYSKYCEENGYRRCAQNTFGTRLRRLGYTDGRSSAGKFFFITQE